MWKDLNLRFSAPKADDLDRASLHTVKTVSITATPFRAPRFMSALKLKTEQPNTWDVAVMERTIGLEPITSTLEASRSAKLSYVRNVRAPFQVANHKCDY